jgi:hypothetical protein
MCKMCLYYVFLAQCNINMPTVIVNDKIIIIQKMYIGTRHDFVWW